MRVLICCILLLGVGAFAEKKRPMADNAALPVENPMIAPLVACTTISLRKQVDSLRIEGKNIGGFLSYAKKKTSVLTCDE
ncbi:hypothetical protein CEXT_713931 [Caerostris extrusa]|uniref:Uncharacterized protein n=1 Tax=Caerostris extrusa TaxID=172846 RepID=A0AAV4N5W5_CAEEX|nr:hypothetical protein CEXT_713931 [Caerostris extrusa]